MLLVVVVLAAAQFDGAERAWQRVRSGDPVWLLAAVALEGLSFWGYALVVAGTARRAGLRLRRRTTWQIVLAGVAATRLFATAGAGGVATTTIALRRKGLTLRTAAAVVAAQLAIVYAWFAVLLTGVGTTLFLSGSGSAAFTIVPAAICGAGLAVAIGGRPLLRRLVTVTSRSPRRLVRVLAVALQTIEESTNAVADLARRRDAAVIGGAVWWVADAAVLWASCQAFGAVPNMLEVCMAYLLGQIANLLPVPGGLGVEAGLAGGLIAFGVPSSVAVLASLTQRMLSTWLPAIPGVVALSALGPFSALTGDVPAASDQTPRP